MSAEPTAPARAKLPAAVMSLGFVSLFTDVSSEMIFPLVPIFLTQVLGAGPAFFGLVEGAAEAVASLLKLISGRLSDRVARLKPLVLGGYSVSTVVRPLMGLAAAPWQVLAIRVTDRLGKGLRTSPRDALISAVAPTAMRGKAFGFQRAMDHAGAAAGTLVAAVLLFLHVELRHIFLFAAIPGVFSVAVLAAIREPERPTSGAAAVGREPLPRSLWRYLAVVVLFGLANSSDGFIILKLTQTGAPTSWAPLMWFLLHAVRSSVGTLGGALADRFGRGKLLGISWAIYAVAYTAFALTKTPIEVILVAVFYGLYHALGEGAERALLVDLTPAGARGRAFGWYNGGVGLAMLAGSVGFGFVWEKVSSEAAFLVGGSIAAACALLLPSALRGSRGTSAT